MNTPTVDAYLGIGSNLEPRERYMQGAVDALRRLPSSQAAVTGLSSVYETTAWDMHGDKAFYNGVVRLRTCEPLERLRAICERIELEHQRDPAGKGLRLDRTLDIDVLLYGDLVSDRDGYCVPHRQLHERLYVLLPLAELAAALVHPVRGTTIAELLAAGDFTGQRAVRATWQWA